MLDMILASKMLVSQTLYHKFAKNIYKNVFLYKFQFCFPTKFFFIRLCYSKCYAKNVLAYCKLNYIVKTFNIFKRNLKIKVNS